MKLDQLIKQQAAKPASAIAPGLRIPGPKLQNNSALNGLTDIEGISLVGMLWRMKDWSINHGYQTTPVCRPRSRKGKLTQPYKRTGSLGKDPSKIDLASKIRDTIIPIALIVLGLTLFAIAGSRTAGIQRVGKILAFVVMHGIVSTAMIVFAAYIAAGTLGVSCGELNVAALKLSAVYILPAAIAILIPFGAILALFLWLGLLIGLFRLGVYPAALSAILLFVARTLLGCLIAPVFG